jgi:hypothetical protein
LESLLWIPNCMKRLLLCWFYSFRLFDVNIITVVWLWSWCLLSFIVYLDYRTICPLLRADLKFRIMENQFYGVFYENVCTHIESKTKTKLIERLVTAKLSIINIFKQRQNQFRNEQEVFCHASSVFQFENSPCLTILWIE